LTGCVTVSFSSRILLHGVSWLVGWLIGWLAGWLIRQVCSSQAHSVMTRATSVQL